MTAWPGPWRRYTRVLKVWAVCDTCHTRTEAVGPAGWYYRRAGFGTVERRCPDCHAKASPP